MVQVVFRVLPHLKIDTVGFLIPCIEIGRSTTIVDEVSRKTMTSYVSRFIFFKLEEVNDHTSLGVFKGQVLLLFINKFHYSISHRTKILIKS